MSQAVHGCLIIVKTGPLGPVQYKVENDVARSAEGDPAEAGGLSASSLPWSINRPAQMLESPQNGQQKYPILH